MSWAEDLGTDDRDDELDNTQLGILESKNAVLQWNVCSMADRSWDSALVGKRSQLGAWDCIAGRKCGFKSNFAWRDVQSLGAAESPLLEPASQLREARRVGGRRGLSVQVRCSGAGGGQGGAHSIAIGRQPSRHESSSKKLPLHPSSRALSMGGTRQQWMHASWWQKRATKSRSRSCLCSKRLWRQRWNRPREAGTYHAGCERDAATLLSLLAAAFRQGQQQCYLPSSIRNQDLDAFLVTVGQPALLFPSAASPRHAACASHAICDCTERAGGNRPFPGFQAMQRTTWSCLP